MSPLPAGLSRRRLILLLGALSALGPLSIDMYLPAFPAIQASLHTSAAQVQLSLATFFIGLSLGQLVYGPLADQKGRKGPLLIGLSIYMVASLGAAIAPNIETLIACRLLQALGGCAGMVITRAITRDLFSTGESAKIFSQLMLVMGLAPILAPTLGNWVNQALGWRGIFGVLAGFSALMLLLVARFLPETKTRPAAPWKLQDTLKGYQGLLQDRSFMGYTLTGSCLQAGMFAYITGSPFVLMNLFGLSEHHYTWVFAANAAAMIFTAQLNGWLLRTRSFEQILKPMLGGLLVIGGGLATVGLSHWGGLAALLGLLFMYVGALGMIQPNTTAGALAEQQARAGTASALLGTLQFTVAAVASATVSLLQDGTARPMTGVMAVCTLLAMVVYTWKSHSPRPQPSASVA